jgi:hypothetical protein
MARVTFGDFVGWAALMLAGAGYIAFTASVLIHCHH